MIIKFKKLIRNIRNIGNNDVFDEMLEEYSELSNNNESN